MKKKSYFIYAAYNKIKKKEVKTIYLILIKNIYQLMKATINL